MIGGIGCGNLKLNIQYDSSRTWDSPLSRQLYTIAVFAFAGPFLCSCDVMGHLIVHNGQMSEVTVQAIDSDNEPAAQNVKAGSAGYMLVFWNGPVAFRVASEDSEYCYEVKKYPIDWLSKGRLNVMLSADNNVYAYRQNSEGEVVLDAEPPEQPDGFPLWPIECDRLH